MPSLVATTSTLARKPCVRKHYVRSNINVALMLLVISLELTHLWMKVQSVGKVCFQWDGYTC